LCGQHKAQVEQDNRTFEAWFACLNPECGYISYRERVTADGVPLINIPAGQYKGKEFWQETDRSPIDANGKVLRPEDRQEQ